MFIRNAICLRASDTSGSDCFAPGYGLDGYGWLAVGPLFYPDVRSQEIRSHYAYDVMMYMEFGRKSD